MLFEVLGAVRVFDDAGVATPLRVPKVASVLAALLASANKVVSIDQLIVEAWGDSPPRRPVAGIHVYVSQLRKIFNGLSPTANPIVTYSPGYLLRVGPDELDAARFHRAVETSRAHLRRQRYEEASRELVQALAMWRGAALEHLRDGPIAHGYASWLEELRLETVEMYVEASLQLGRHRELVGYLYELVAQYPLNEAFYRQLMFALYRSERRADALRVYRTAHDVLIRELGLEPGPMLRELQRMVLNPQLERPLRVAS